MIAMLALLTTTLQQAPCEALKSVSLPNVTITAASFVSEGAPQAPAVQPVPVPPGHGRGPLRARLYHQPAEWRRPLVD